MKNSKNHRNNPKILVSTLNVRTLSDDAYLSELENAISKINFDIVGICEVKRKGEEVIEKKEFSFYYFGTSTRLAGVGFLIHNRWKNNKKSFKSISSRVTTLTMYINESKTLSVIQVYAPTSAAKDKDMDQFYNDVDEALEITKNSTWKIVLGDFNAKIGVPQSHENDVLGPFGVGVRNERGSRLIRFCRQNRLVITNTMFKRKSHQKWTWKSPNLLHTNEIDFILTSNKSFVKNVEVLNRFEFETDHRMVRMTFKLCCHIKRPKFKKNLKILVNQLDSKKILEFNTEMKSSLKKASHEKDLKYDEFQALLLEKGETFKASQNKHQVLTTEVKLMIDSREVLRRKAQQNPVFASEYIQQRRKTKNAIRRDVRNYNLLMIDNAIRNNQGLKVAREGITRKKNKIQSLRDKNGNDHYDDDEILEIAVDFYKLLFSSNLSDVEKSQVEPVMSDKVEVPTITVEEIKETLALMKNNKSCGNDGIPVDLLKVCDDYVLKELAKLFNKFTSEEKVPESWCESQIILIFKKGKKNEITNYRPISLISHIYKIFCKIILCRIDSYLDENQSLDQAGFRKGFSTTDHLLVVNQLVEKFEEFQKNLHIAFIDYSKAFDSVEVCHLLKALKNQNVPEKYVRIIKNIYETSKASLTVGTCGEKFSLERGVKQGDPMSPKLFNAVLESVFRSLKWENYGIQIENRRLSNLRFADDVVLFAESKNELIEMIQSLKVASKTVGLEMNEEKSKIINNSGDDDYYVDGSKIEVVEDYKYLGQVISFKNRQSKEVDVRISAAWRSFWALKSFLLSELPMFHKRKLMDCVILPIFTYGAQTWSLSKENERKLQVEQRAMERKILKISRLDHITNEEIRKKSKIKDLLLHAKTLKWNFCGHVQRTTDERWTKIVENWTPPNGRRKRGHQLKRWSDEIEEIGLGRWREKAKDRIQWKNLRESFVQKWTDMG
jgi:hypothetical protein